MPDHEPGFIRYFAALPDPRVNRTKKHALADILGVTLCAVICGADSFEEIARFGDAREQWLKQYFPLTNGIPSHDTFNRVLAALDRNIFAACFGTWMADLNTATGLKAIAIDGKACRGAPGDTFSGCLHLVRAWATANGLILGQEAVPDNGHEITTIPVLLKALDLKGAVVTIDAAGCQKAIVEQVRAQGGDYVVTVKGNQPSLHRAAVAAFARAGDTAWAECDMASSVEDGHGRHEERYVTVIRAPEGLPDGWTGVSAVVVVGREREVKGTNASTCHFDLTSLRATAAELGGYIRGHWGVENGLHWCLDIAFREDQNRTRDTNAGANLGVVRRVAASLLKQDTGKGSIKAKRLNAAWNHEYLERVLQGFKAN
jgi:predicted transposase YbfD/YdcC